MSEETRTIALAAMCEHMRHAIWYLDAAGIKFGGYAVNVNNWHRPGAAWMTCSICHICVDHADEALAPEAKEKA